MFAEANLFFKTGQKLTPLPPTMFQKSNRRFFIYENSGNLRSLFKRTSIPSRYSYRGIRRAIIAA